MRTTNTWLLCAVLLGGCGGADASAEGETTDETTGGETTTEAEGPALADLAWDDVPPDQRGHWMAEVIVPAMGPLFQEHDAEEFAEFGCATCHGETGADVHFEMPNGIAPLVHEFVPAMFQSEEPMPVFMTQTVYPRMAELLGEALYDPETRTGFSCFDCHGEMEIE